MQKVIVFPGQRVIAQDGRAHIVAFVASDGTVFAHGPSGQPTPIRVVCDAWGGEHVLDTFDAQAALFPARPRTHRPKATSAPILRLAA